MSGPPGLSDKLLERVHINDVTLTKAKLDMRVMCTVTADTPHSSHHELSGRGLQSSAAPRGDAERSADSLRWLWQRGILSCGLEALGVFCFPLTSHTGCQSLFMLLSPAFG